MNCPVLLQLNFLTFLLPSHVKMRTTCFISFFHFFFLKSRHHATRPAPAPVSIVISDGRTMAANVTSTSGRAGGRRTVPVGWIALNSRHVRARFSNITTSASAPIPASTLHIRCTLLRSLLSPHAHHCAPSAHRRLINPHHLSSCPDPPHPMRLFLLQRQILSRLVAPDLSLHCP
jgi:hypothetical protein